MTKIIDEFNFDFQCESCDLTTEHSIQKIDELEDGRYFAYYTECLNCGYMGDFSVDYFEKEILKVNS